MPRPGSGREYASASAPISLSSRLVPKQLFLNVSASVIRLPSSSSPTYDAVTRVASAVLRFCVFRAAIVVVSIARVSTARVLGTASYLPADLTAGTAHLLSPPTVLTEAAWAACMRSL